MTTRTERQAAFRTTIEHFLKERLDAKFDVFKLLKLHVDERRLLARKLEAHDLPLAFASVGVICRDFAEQVTEGGSLKAFRLSRKPLDKDGASAAIVEEGCMQMEIRLIFGVSGGVTSPAKPPRPPP